eukprot:MONOS_3144.1-p1 / transcript=MONOS_3144.1 / gene=MONOS_3144 / organism=Monocercomonoides_exilis_PA203 / gene_product=unspecified product / transcript_product=unspecified product / location=Mono_scaffold00071:119691-125112(+) / protein_length=1757 / sequence_SO=supercontig / SO=protein_coding / is_pseudo=false
MKECVNPYSECMESCPFECHDASHEDKEKAILKAIGTSLFSPQAANGSFSLAVNEHVDVDCEMTCKDVSESCLSECDDSCAAACSNSTNSDSNKPNNATADGLSAECEECLSRCDGACTAGQRECLKECDAAASHRNMVDACDSQCGENTKICLNFAANDCYARCQEEKEKEEESEEGEEGEGEGEEGKGGGEEEGEYQLNLMGMKTQQSQGVSSALRGTRQHKAKRGRKRAYLQPDATNVCLGRCMAEQTDMCGKLFIGCHSQCEEAIIPANVEGNSTKNGSVAARMRGVFYGTYASRPARTQQTANGMSKFEGKGAEQEEEREREKERERERERSKLSQQNQQSRMQIRGELLRRGVVQQTQSEEECQAACNDTITSCSAQLRNYCAGECEERSRKKKEMKVSEKIRRVKGGSESEAAEGGVNDETDCFITCIEHNLPQCTEEAGECSMLCVDMFSEEESLRSGKGKREGEGEGEREEEKRKKNKGRTEEETEKRRERVQNIRKRSEENRRKSGKEENSNSNQKESEHTNERKRQANERQNARYPNRFGRQPVSSDFSVDSDEDKADLWKNEQMEQKTEGNEYSKRYMTKGVQAKRAEKGEEDYLGKRYPSSRQDDRYEQRFENRKRAEAAPSNSHLNDASSTSSLSSLPSSAAVSSSTHSPKHRSQPLSSLLNGRKLYGSEEEEEEEEGEEVIECDMTCKEKDEQCREEAERECLNELKDRQSKHTQVRYPSASAFDGDEAKGEAEEASFAQLSIEMKDSAKECLEAKLALCDAKNDSCVMKCQVKYKTKTKTKSKIRMTMPVEVEEDEGKYMDEKEEEGKEEKEEEEEEDVGKAKKEEEKEKKEEERKKEEEEEEEEEGEEEDEEEEEEEKEKDKKKKMKKEKKKEKKREKERKRKRKEDEEEEDAKNEEEEEEEEEEDGEEEEVEEEEQKEKPSKSKKPKTPKRKYRPLSSESNISSSSSRSTPLQSNLPQNSAPKQLALSSLQALRKHNVALSRQLAQINASYEECAVECQQTELQCVDVCHDERRGQREEQDRQGRQGRQGKLSVLVQQWRDRKNGEMERHLHLAGDIDNVIGRGRGRDRGREANELALSSKGRARGEAIGLSVRKAVLRQFGGGEIAGCVNGCEEEAQRCSDRCRVTRQVLTEDAMRQANETKGDLLGNIRRQLKSVSRKTPSFYGSEGSKNTMSHSEQLQSVQNTLSFDLSDVFGDESVTEKLSNRRQTERRGSKLFQPGVAKRSRRTAGTGAFGVESEVGERNATDEAMKLCEEETVECFSSSVDMGNACLSSGRTKTYCETLVKRGLLDCTSSYEKCMSDAEAAEEEKEVQRSTKRFGSSNEAADQPAEMIDDEQNFVSFDGSSDSRCDAAKRECYSECRRFRQRCIQRQMKSGRKAEDSYRDCKEATVYCNMGCDEEWRECENEMDENEEEDDAKEENENEKAKDEEKRNVMQKTNEAKKGETSRQNKRDVMSDSTKRKADEKQVNEKEKKEAERNGTADSFTKDDIKRMMKNEQPLRYQQRVEAAENGIKARNVAMISRSEKGDRQSQRYQQKHYPDSQSTHEKKMNEEAEKKRREEEEEKEKKKEEEKKGEERRKKEKEEEDIERKEENEGIKQRKMGKFAEEEVKKEQINRNSRKMNQKEINDEEREKQRDAESKQLIDEYLKQLVHKKVEDRKYEQRSSKIGAEMSESQSNQQNINPKERQNFKFCPTTKECEKGYKRCVEMCQKEFSENDGCLNECNSLAEECFATACS